MAYDKEAVKGCVLNSTQDLLNLYSEETNEEVIANTAERCARAHFEIMSGYDKDPEEILARTFPTNDDDMVAVTNIPVISMCEHHLMPFRGHAHVGYIPNGELLGVSKIARLVDCYARRMQLQERITSETANAIMDHVNVKGVGVVVVAEHTCMTSRGVNMPGALTVTSAMRGMFRDDDKTRAEFMTLIGVKS